MAFSQQHPSAICRRRACGGLNPALPTTRLCRVPQHFIVGAGPDRSHSTYAGGGPRPHSQHRAPEPCVPLPSMPPSVCMYVCMYVCMGTYYGEETVLHALGRARARALGQATPG